MDPRIEQHANIIAAIGFANPTTPLNKLLVSKDVSESENVIRSGEVLGKILYKVWHGVSSITETCLKNGHEQGKQFLVQVLKPYAQANIKFETFGKVGALYDKENQEYMITYPVKHRDDPAKDYTGQFLLKMPFEHEDLSIPLYISSAFEKLGKKLAGMDVNETIASLEKALKPVRTR